MLESGNRSLGQSNIEWCLDFTDTIDWRTSDHAEDKIPDYEDLVEWSYKKGILSRDEVLALGELVRENPSIRDEVMKDARSLREAMYRIFSAVAHGRRVDSSDIEILNEVLSRGLGRKKVELAREGFVWSWRGDFQGEVMLFLLAQSAADLLTSEDLARVKECANEEQGCGSLFLDRSKGQTRKWCSMESCGNRAKLRTYYKRHKQQIVES